MRRLSYLLVLLSGCQATLLPGGDTGDGGNPAGDGAVDAATADLTKGPACGDVFCQVGEVCELGACHRDCAGATRCGLPPTESCCAAGDVCYLAGCVTPGAACGAMPGTCALSTCPNGQYCEPSIGHCLPLGPMNACEYHPPTGAFSPVVKWEWQGSQSAPSYNQVMMTPVVADLDGDCMPDVVFITFSGGNYTTDGVIRAVRGDGSAELWTQDDPNLRAVPGGEIALADVDGDGKLEIFACNQSGVPMALNHDGSLKWMGAQGGICGFDAPFVADVDHDGAAEVGVGFWLFDAKTGALKMKPQNEPAHGYFSTAAELDGNPANGMEIVGGGIVYHADGSLYWNQLGVQGGNIGYPAVADLDGDGLPEVVSVSSGQHSIYVYHHDGMLMWGPVDVNNGVATPLGPSGGGPPTIADFDGNGHPDVATAGGYGYLVLDGMTGVPLWQSTDTTDTSSRVTGSSVFDFEGDGPAEAIYNDEHNLRVYRGADGHVLVKICSTSGTLWENPVIVDVDADDHAEIVVMDNNYAFNTCDADVGGGRSHSGFKVLGDAMNRWVRTRRIWNQHTYHVTNVNDDGTIPTDEALNWTQPGLDDFRQNVQTKNVFNAPDLVPRDLRALKDNCPTILTLAATVLNQGAAVAPAGIPVTFYLGPPGAMTVIGTVHTQAVILPGAAESITFPWTPPANTTGPYQITVVVDDDGTVPGQPNGIVNECDETNNTSAPTMLGCPQIG